MHKYISIPFLVLVTVFAAAKIILLKVSFSCYISGVIFPGLSQSIAIFYWLPFESSTFHLCSPGYVARLSLRAFPYTEHHHILNMRISCVLLSFDLSFQLMICGNWKTNTRQLSTSFCSRATKILDYI